jgi:hypothetical protein
MKRLMRADPGLPRRFPKEIHLDDYTPAELATIAEFTANSKGLTFEEGLPQKLAKSLATP